MGTAGGEGTLLAGGRTAVFSQSSCGGHPGALCAGGGGRRWSAGQKTGPADLQTLSKVGPLPHMPGGMPTACHLLLGPKGEWGKVEEGKGDIDGDGRRLDQGW